MEASPNGEVVSDLYVLEAREVGRVQQQPLRRRKAALGPSWIRCEVLVVLALTKVRFSGRRRRGFIPRRHLCSDCSHHAKGSVKFPSFSTSCITTCMHCTVYLFKNRSAVIWSTIQPSTSMATLCMSLPGRMLPLSMRTGAGGGCGAVPSVVVHLPEVPAALTLPPEERAAIASAGYFSALPPLSPLFFFFNIITSA